MYLINIHNHDSMLIVILPQMVMVSMAAMVLDGFLLPKVGVLAEFAIVAMVSMVFVLLVASMVRKVLWCQKCI